MTLKYGGQGSIQEKKNTRTTNSSQTFKTKKEKNPVQIKRYYNNSAKKDEKFKLYAKYSTKKKKSMQLNELFK